MEEQTDMFKSIVSFCVNPKVLWGLILSLLLLFGVSNVKNDFDGPLLVYFEGKTKQLR